MTERNALDGIVDIALDFVAPLVLAAGDEQSMITLLNQMGWSAPDLDVEDSVTRLLDTVEALRSGLDFGSIDALAKTLGSLADTVGALVSFADEFAAAAGQVSAEVVEAFAADLVNHLTVLYIGREPALYSAFELIGLIERRPAAPVAPGAPLSRLPVLRPVFAPEVVGELLRDPIGHLRNRLGVRPLADEEAARRVLDEVFRPLLNLVVMAGGRGVVGLGGVEPEAPTPEDDAARRRATFIMGWLGAIVELVPTGVGDGPGMRLTPYGELRIAGEELALEVSGDIVSVFFPAGGAPVVDGPDGVTLRLTYTRATTDGQAFKVGSDSARLTVEGFTAGVTARLGAQLDLEVQAAVERARFTLAPAEGDGFLASVLPADGLAFDFDLGIGWSNRRGVFFAGAAGLAAELPLHVDLLGVLTVEVLHLGLRADADHIETRVGVTTTLRLGPVSATVQEIGFQGRATFPEGGGNLGPLDVVPRFLPPRGVGLTIKAAAVTGGGFVRNEPEKGRYQGILELAIGDVVAVTAIGLISTGDDGFSLLVILTAEFPPIQLGFGFTLSGLGGILGLNRTMNVDTLRDGARTGVLDSILFPRDPVARAAQVIADVESVFPTAPGRFTIGLMARLSWGSPQIVECDLGLVLELPLPLKIALLGRLGVVLPDPDAAIVVLRLDVVGILDLGRGELSVDATLRDSRVAVFDVYGDMALRIGWGATPAFAISVGGFNPRFTPPPGFPALRRLTIALASGDNPRVRLETYLATTSNTLQVGARLDAHAELKAGVLGLFSADVYLGFDALITLSPFQFIVDFGGGIVIKRGGDPFIGAELVLTLYGPQPLRATGYAEVHFFGRHRIPIDVSIGAEPEQTAIFAEDPVDDLVTAITDPDSWSALPPGGEAVVVLRETIGTALLAPPGGSLSVRQRVVPLGVTIQRYGGAPLPGGPRAYTLTYTVGGQPVSPGEPVRDSWAPGDLFTLTDDEKLSWPAFDSLISGSSGIGTPPARSGTPVQAGQEEYETWVIDEDDPKPRPIDPGVAPPEPVHAPARGPAVTLAGPSFAVASTTTLALLAGPFPSWVEAAAMARTLPGAQVVAAHEAVRP
ncbi:DUF6603 domain-containing protein [Streptosporangium sp. NPDC002544]|uniref:DUF6603 domain-containing protein n=1 Tax=Streptosporangium sp. NPDC002544 TaxID=3154538 RepID=UPI00332AADCE